MKISTQWLLIFAVAACLVHSPAFAGKDRKKTYAEVAAPTEEFPPLPSSTNSLKTEEVPAPVPTVEPIKVEQEPWALSRIFGYLADTTNTALNVLQSLDNGKKENLLGKTHKVERGVNDTISKAILVETSNTQANSIDRLQAILRANEVHQKNLQTLFDGAQKHGLQINDVTSTSAFKHCQNNTTECIKYLQAVAENVSALLELNQDIESSIAMSTTSKTRLVVDTKRYENLQRIIDQLRKQK